MNHSENKNSNNKERIMPKQSNRLIHETSPYLRQHAHNPVNWYPWSEEAFAEAKRLDKPVLLSVGYAACHWCHVMEKESFEDEEIAALMNDLFINIKVDREERPDIDQIYMRFVQTATGSGGWPMTVILTPEKEPFFGGTYFPPDDRYGRPGFPKVLKSISNYYHNEKDQLNKVLDQIDNIFTEIDAEEIGGGELPNRDTFNRAVEKLSQYYEIEYGGIGQAPKFPAVQSFQLFLRKYHNDKNKEFLRMLEHTLKNMGRGGIFDQLGGGFARYSVDTEWLVPHFEKMLYDNAQLITLYLNTYLKTKDEFYLNIALETLTFVEREMISDEGGFCSSLDADSDGEEGKYYAWSRNEVINILGEEKGLVFCEYYDISDEGNFEGNNILRIKNDKIHLQKKFNKSAIEIDTILTMSKRILLNERSKRVRPELDDKIIVSWNGMMLSAFAKAYQVTGNERYAIIIRKNITFMMNKLVNDKKLLHTYKDNQAKIDAFLDDYANLINGLLDSYEALFEIEYFQWADELTNYVNKKFWDSQNFGYFFTSIDQEKLLSRLKDEHDQSIPSATGIMLMNLLRLSSYTGKTQYTEIAEQILSKYSDDFIENPYGFASYLIALDYYLNKPKEIIIISEDKIKSKELLQFIYNLYLPNKILICLDERKIPTIFNEDIIKGKYPINHKTTIYVCSNFSCSPPITNSDDLLNFLQ